MSFKCSSHHKIVFDHLRMTTDMVNTVFICRIGIKYIKQIASRTVCAYAHVFQKLPGCALIGACALIRMNTVCHL